MNEDGDEEPRRPSALRQMFMAECLFSDAGESRFGMNVYQFYLYQIGIYNFDLNGKFTSQTEKDERNRQTKKKTNPNGQTYDKYEYESSVLGIWALP